MRACSKASACLGTSPPAGHSTSSSSAKHAHLEKNERDLAAALPRLERERRVWLRDAVARVHPGHKWLDVL